MTGLRILIVEDDILVGQLVAEMLAEMGHEICAVETTETAAVRAAAEHRPDLMIVDVRLGDGSGITAIDLILTARVIPHVFASGNIDKVRKLRPAAILLEKPFHEAELANAIARAMAHRPTGTAS